MMCAQVHDVDSLNNRFRPLLPIETEAVFSVDDDLHVPCETLDFTHGVWRAAPRAMVGFMPRMHGAGPGGRLVYETWWHVWRHGVYSLILTKVRGKRLLSRARHHKGLILKTRRRPR